MRNQGYEKINSFKIENFKGIECLTLKKIKQFNLILGDNNVGKTSVLEALTFNDLPNAFLNCLFSIFYDKSGVLHLTSESFSNIKYFKNFIKKNNQLENQFIKYTYESISNNINEIKIEIINDYSFNKSIVDNLLNNCFLEINKLPNEILKFKRNNKIDYFSFDFQSHKIKDDSTYYPFVKTGLAYNIDIVDHFSDTILSDINLKKEFLNHIKLFSNEIYDFSISTTEIPKMNTLMVLFENGGSLPLFMMGDGTIRLVRLILEILKSKNSRLMIDEIDNGIHFSRMKEVWRVILKVAKQNNTQLFLTTHDAECLKMFKEVLEEEDMVDLQNDVACFTLFRNKEKMVDSVQYNFKEFEHAIDYSLNIRG